MNKWTYQKEKLHRGCWGEPPRPPLQDRPAHPPGAVFEADSCQLRPHLGTALSQRKPPHPKSHTQWQAADTQWHKAFSPMLQGRQQGRAIPATELHDLSWGLSCDWLLFLMNPAAFIPPQKHSTTTFCRETPASVYQTVEGTTYIHVAYTWIQEALSFYYVLMLSLHIHITYISVLYTHICTHTHRVVVLSMWELDHKEGWALKNWGFWTVVLEKTLESPWDCKEIQPVHPKGNQRWIFIGMTNAEAKAPVLWPPDVKSQLTEKDPDAGNDWGQEKRAAEDEIVGWHHWLSVHESEQNYGRQWRTGKPGML